MWRQSAARGLVAAVLVTVLVACAEAHAVPSSRTWPCSHAAAENSPEVLQLLRKTGNAFKQVGDILLKKTGAAPSSATSAQSPPSAALYRPRPAATVPHYGGVYPHPYYYYHHPHSVPIPSAQPSMYPVHYPHYVPAPQMQYSVQAAAQQEAQVYPPELSNHLVSLANEYEQAAQNECSCGNVEVNMRQGPSSLAAGKASDIVVEVTLGDLTQAEEEQGQQQQCAAEQQKKTVNILNISEASEQGGEIDADTTGKASSSASIEEKTIEEADETHTIQVVEAIKLQPETSPLQVETFDNTAAAVEKTIKETVVVKSETEESKTIVSNNGETVINVKTYEESFPKTQEEEDFLGDDQEEEEEVLEEQSYIPELPQPSNSYEEKVEVVEVKEEKLEELKKEASVVSEMVETVDIEQKETVDKKTTVTETKTVTQTETANKPQEDVKIIVVDVDNNVAKKNTTQTATGDAQYVEYDYEYVDETPDCVDNDAKDLQKYFPSSQSASKSVPKYAGESEEKKSHLQEGEHLLAERPHPVENVQVVIKGTSGQTYAEGLQVHSAAAQQQQAQSTAHYHHAAQAPHPAPQPKPKPAVAFDVPCEAHYGIPKPGHRQRQQQQQIQQQKQWQQQQIQQQQQWQQQQQQQQLQQQQQQQQQQQFKQQQIQQQLLQQQQIQQLLIEQQQIQQQQIQKQQQQIQQQQQDDLTQTNVQSHHVTSHKMRHYPAPQPQPWPVPQTPAPDCEPEPEPIVCEQVQSAQPAQSQQAAGFQYQAAPPVFYARPTPQPTPQYVAGPPVYYARPTPAAAPQQPSPQYVAGPPVYYARPTPAPAPQQPSPQYVAGPPVFYARPTPASAPQQPSPQYVAGSPVSYERPTPKSVPQQPAPQYIPGPPVYYERPAPKSVPQQPTTKYLPGPAVYYAPQQQTVQTKKSTVTQYKSSAAHPAYGYSSQQTQSQSSQPASSATYAKVAPASDFASFGQGLHHRQQQQQQTAWIQPAVQSNTQQAASKILVGAVRDATKQQSKSSKTTPAQYPTYYFTAHSDSIYAPPMIKNIKKQPAQTPAAKPSAIFDFNETPGSAEQDSAEVIPQRYASEVDYKPAVATPARAPAVQSFSTLVEDSAEDQPTFQLQKKPAPTTRVVEPPARRFSAPVKSSAIEKEPAFSVQSYSVPVEDDIDVFESSEPLELAKFPSSVSSIKIEKQPVSSEKATASAGTSGGHILTEASLPEDEEW
ncbi:titin-like isoform X3 [Frankliniella occidentalis]|uniref:Titin-like isoform X3 n=1 Tax=Frankliniella occidentalis TaxID=133901 RepID=A0A9C6WZK3_FRAOC|nr:titin-like isoform X3 [Frankliniella occidentalis]